MCAANQEKVNMFASAQHTDSPHRFGGGKCTGFHVVAKQWYTFFGSGACENCTSHSDGSCQVVEGRESEKECPVFQEFVDFEEIRLLGSYWKRTW